MTTKHESVLKPFLSVDLELEFKQCYIFLVLYVLVSVLLQQPYRYRPPFSIHLSYYFLAYRKLHDISGTKLMTDSKRH